MHASFIEQQAFRSTLFYIFASANIFMSALYTESSFSMLTFWGIYTLISGGYNLIIPTMFFSISSLFRSNGLLSMIFVSFHAWSSRKYFDSFLSCSTIYLPYLLYSLWAKNLYCYTDTSSPHNWCDSESSIYSHVQKSFWNVSLFSYWKLANWPYFVLMIPTLIVSTSAAVYFVKDWIKHRKVPVNHLPYLAQMGLLTAFTLFVANVQILTRILSSCPLYFWTIERVTREEGKFGKLILAIHLGYFLVGPIVFANGINWT